MDENIKNLREAQQQSGSQKNDSAQTEETDAVDVQVASKEKQKEEGRSRSIVAREDTLKDGLRDQMSDPMRGEELSDTVVEGVFWACSLR